jgi:hypothetical protein
MTWLTTAAGCIQDDHPQRQKQHSNTVAIEHSLLMEVKLHLEASAACLSGPATALQTHGTLVILFSKGSGVWESCQRSVAAHAMNLLTSVRAGPVSGWCGSSHCCALALDARVGSSRHQESWAGCQRVRLGVSGPVLHNGMGAIRKRRIAAAAHARRSAVGCLRALPRLLATRYCWRSSRCRSPAARQTGATSVRVERRDERPWVVWQAQISVSV